MTPQVPFKYCNHSPSNWDKMIYLQAIQEDNDRHGPGLNSCLFPNPGNCCFPSSQISPSISNPCWSWPELGHSVFPQKRVAQLPSLTSKQRKSTSTYAGKVPPVTQSLLPIPDPTQHHVMWESPVWKLTDNLGLHIWEGFPCLAGGRRHKFGKRSCNADGSWYDFIHHTLSTNKIRSLKPEKSVSLLKL